MKSTNTWILMFHKSEVAFISSNGKVDILREDLLPYNIYLEESNDIDALINNITNFYAWCSSRILSLDRVYAKQIMNSIGIKQAVTDKDRVEIALSYNCVSLRDQYWVKESNSDVSYDDINLFDNSLGNIIDVSLRGKSIILTNLNLITKDLTTNGTRPKSWVRKGDSFELYKDDSDNKEVRASNALISLGFDVLKYFPVAYDSTACSKCNCFTSKELNYVTAGEYECTYEVSFLIKTYFYKQFMTMLLCDYLIGNSDRHQDNWGFLFNNDRVITSFAPIHDFDHAFEADVNSLCLPMLLFGERESTLTSARRAVNCLGINKDALLNNVSDEYVRDRIELLFENPDKPNRESLLDKVVKEAQQM